MCIWQHVHKSLFRSAVLILDLVQEKSDMCDCMCISMNIHIYIVFLYMLVYVYL